MSSRLIVNSIRHTGASGDAVSLANDGTCTANITNNLSNRNLLINGAHIVWQRATSIAGGSVLDNFVYATDRFWLYSPSSSSGTVGQSTDVPSGFIYSTHNNLDAACTIGTNVELLKAGSDAPFVNGESLTLSFYIKSTSARSNVGISISTRDNAGGTNSVTRASGVTFNTTTGWTRVEKTFTLSGTVGGSNACLQFEISLAIGDKVTGFQLEKNSFATDFEHRSFAQELALCQRYYYLHARYAMAGNTGNVVVTDYGTQYTSSVVFTSFKHPVEMRTKPSMECSTVSNGFIKYAAGSNAAFNSFSLDGITNRANAAVNVSISGTAGHAVMLRTNDVSGAFLAFSAEI